MSRSLGRARQFFFVTLVLAGGVTGCGEKTNEFILNNSDMDGGGSDTDTDSGTGTATDADTGSDSDTDADSDADTDADSDTDTNTDTDSESNGDAGSDSGTDTDTYPAEDAGGGDVPACIHECVPESFCDTRGTVHDDMTCPDSSEVCCEPRDTEDACTFPMACLSSGSCPDEDVEEDYKCVKSGNVCCDVDRCEQNGGNCFSSAAPVFNCPLGQQYKPQYYCPGTRAKCCM